MNESLRLRAVQAPIIPVIADLIRRHPGTISLGQGVVSYGPPPGISAYLERCLAEPNNHKYQPVSGIAPLLARVGEKLRVENGVSVETDTRLMITAGGNQAFMNAVLAIADPGDEFILPTPYYFNQEMAVTMAGCRPVLVPTDRNHQLDLAALQSAVTPRTRAIVTVSPNNPTGAVYPAEALRAVNQLCAANGIFHLSDEAYEHFTYDDAVHFSPASLPGAGAHTISLYSMSKSHGFASWRIGWMVFPERLEAALRKVQDTLLICPPVVSQFAALGALETGRDYVLARRQELVAVRNQVRHALAPLVTEGIADVPPAQGAFYFLLRVHSAQSAVETAERLIREHGVAVIPGTAFGLGTACTLRVAYGALQPATVAEGIGRLVHGLRKLARN